MWLLNACFLLIFPDPVRANLFFGTGFSLNLGHFELMNYFNEIIIGVFFISFGGEHDDHALAFKHRHLLDLAVFLEVVGETGAKAPRPAP